MEHIIYYCSEYNVMDALRFVLDKNKSVGYGYHNTNHCLKVADMACFISGTLNVDSNERKLILLAGLFHDVNHLMDKHDDLNVESAMDTFSEFNNKVLHLNDDDSSRVLHLIKATQYPYCDMEIDNSIISIRDADMGWCLTLLNNDYFNKTVIGYGVIEQGLSVEQALENQISFLTNLKFSTPFAKDMIDIHRKSRLRDLIEIKGKLFGCIYTELEN